MEPTSGEISKDQPLGKTLERYMAQVGEVNKILRDIKKKSIEKDGVQLQSAELVLDDGSFLATPPVTTEKYPTNIIFTFDNSTEISVFPEHGHDSLELKRLYRNYSDTIEKIVGASKRQLDQERKMILIENLERQRGNLHRQAADQIEQYLNLWEGVTLTKNLEEMRSPGERLFEVYFHLQQFQEPNTLFYTESDLKGKNLDALSENILEATGFEVNIISSVWGFHTGEPKAQYTISAPGASIIDKLRIAEIIDTYPAE